MTSFIETGAAVSANVIQSQNFAVELQVESTDELNYEHFRDAVVKAGGANYGTGVRQL